MRYLLSNGKTVFVKFKHNFNQHVNSPNYGKPTGTSCWIEIDGQKVVEAESYVHKHDHFCKRTGRFISFKKALNKLAFEERWKNDGFKGTVSLTKLERRELFNLMWPEYSGANKYERKLAYLQNLCNNDVEKLRDITKVWKPAQTHFVKNMKKGLEHAKSYLVKIKNALEGK